MEVKMRLDYNTINWPIIYILYKEWCVVYVWESSFWLRRATSHIDKEYDYIDIFKAPVDCSERRIIENELILKYKPKYNSIINAQHLNLRSLWYIQDLEVRFKIKSMLRYDITKNLKKIILSTWEYFYNWKSLWVKYSAIRKVLKDKHLILI